MSDLARNAAITVGFLVFAVLAGAWMTAQDPGIGRQLITVLKDSIVGEALDSNTVMFATKLFLNNLEACLLMFLGGASLGVLTVFIIGTNGFVIGSILEMVRQEHSFLYVVAAIAPHGIFEIPAFVLSGALGLSLAAALWREWLGSEDAAAHAAGLGRIFLLAVLPLVAVAACTEAFITPEILRLVI